MNCEEAQALIDQRVHGELEAEAPAALEAHLAECPNCTADLESLLKTRELTAQLKADQPPAGALAEIWAAVQSKLPDPTAVASELPARTSASASDRLAEREAQPLQERRSRRFREAIAERIKRRRRWLLPLTSGLAACLVLAAAFMIGLDRYEDTGLTAKVAHKTFVDTLGGAKLDVKGEQPTAFKQVQLKHMDGWTAASQLNRLLRSQLKRGERMSIEPLGNRLLISAPPHLIDDVAKMVEQVDVQTTAEPAVQFVSVNYRNANEVAQQLQDFFQSQLRRGERLRIQAMGDKQILLGAPERLAPQIKDTLTKLDVHAEPPVRSAPVPKSIPKPPAPPQVGKSPAAVLGVSHVDPQVVADALKHAFPQRDARRDDHVRIEADPVSNALLVWAPEEKLAEVRKLVKQIDSARGKEGDGQARATPVTRMAPAAKIIKTGDLTLEVEKYTQADERVRKIVAEHEGFVADSRVEEMTGGALRGWLVIRVVPEKFDELFASLRKIGRVASENVQAQDVTAQYVDLQARIKNAQAAEERLRELIKSKSILDKIANLLEVEKELTRVREKIEQMQGRLRVMAGRVALSTIHLTLQEPARTVPSASLSVEVAALSAAQEGLSEALAGLDGQLISGQTKKREDGTLMGEYKLRVKLPRFADLIAAIETLGRIEGKQIKDQQFGEKVPQGSEAAKCDLALVIFERSRQLPAGNVSIEAAELTQAMAKLRAALAEANAAIVSNRTTRRPDGSSTATLSLRVPAGQFQKLMDALPPLGRLTARNVTGETGGITGGAADVPATISLELTERPREVPTGQIAIEVKNFQQALTQFRALLKEHGLAVLTSSSSQRPDNTWVGSFRLGVKAKDLDAVVGEIERLGRVQTRRIQGLGDLSRVDPNVTGEITLSLQEPPTISPEPARAGGSIRGMLRAGLADLYTSVGLVLRGLLVMAPWLLIVATVAWLTARTRRRRAAAKAAGPSSDAP